MASKVASETKNHDIKVIEAPISVSAFLNEKTAKEIISNEDLTELNLILLPGFVQWDTSNLEMKFSIPIRKGPRFLSDLPIVLKKIEKLDLSNKIPACELLRHSGEEEYEKLLENRITFAQKSNSTHTFVINEQFPDKIIGRNLPPLIIAEIINAPEKGFEQLDKKIEHYLNSGADIIDLGCVSNKPNPSRLKEIIEYIKSKYQILLSADTLNSNEINAAIDAGIDLILSLDFGNYMNHLDAPKSMPFVILPTNTVKAVMPIIPEERVNRLFELSEILKNKGFKKLILDPLLETPISPGFVNSLSAYSLYQQKIKEEPKNHLEFPLFFGVSNVVELMDIDSVGINGLLACIAAELDVGVIFTVEHSAKLFKGVQEINDCIRLAYLAKYRNLPPINQGIQVFHAKGKRKVGLPNVDLNKIIEVKESDESFNKDPKGYFKIYTNLFSYEIYVLHYSNEDVLQNTIVGSNAEAVSKKIIKLGSTSEPYHLNYLGRELKNAELCLMSGKHYIQDE